MWSVKKGTPKSSRTCPLALVAVRKTLGLQRLQFRDTTVSSGPPDGADKLLVQQNSIPDGGTRVPYLQDVVRRNF